ncbi:MAG TPA: hypothetical protein PLF26_12970 [Blastocatellia bacterium]|nr:hypothetical protein [Blastocatellia bacterium]
MRIDLNLAKHPFRNRSLFWIVVASVFAVGGAALLVTLARAATVGADTAAEREKIAKQESTIKDLQGRLDELARAKGAAIFTIDDRHALDQARTLIVERSFSWSRLFHDLEAVVPERVRLTSVSVGAIEGEGKDRVVTILISGHGQDIDQMSALLANFDKTGGRFSADPVENGPDADTTDFVFTVLVQYRPDIAVGDAAADTIAAVETRTDG